MSVLLYIIGAVIFVAGAITLAFGFSIELSFGNSLIMAGASGAVGGLIVIGLAAVVSQLQRVTEALLTVRAPIRPSRMPETFEAPSAPRPAAGLTPFPPKPRAAPAEPPVEQPTPLPEAADMPAEDRFAAAPVLPNPDEPPVEVHEEVSLSPPEVAEPARPAPPPGFGKRPLGEPENEEERTRTWRFPPLRSRARPEPPPAPDEPGPPPQSHFDTMWPAEEPKGDKPAEFDKLEPPMAPEPEDTVEQPASAPASEVEPEPVSAAASAPNRPAAPHEDAGERRAVAILKSGVVDGMGYTLYVDGSIEAELPQGTLHFTSINDLRNYLEKNSQA